MKQAAYPSYKPTGVDWLDQVPSHWDMTRLRFALQTNPLSSVLRCPPETIVSFVPMEAVGEYGGLQLDQEKMLADVGSGYTYFKNDDVVVAKITPCFENGKGALAKGLRNGIAFGTTELHVLRARDNIDPTFLFYFTISNAFRDMGEAHMYGAGGQKRVPELFIKDLRCPLPPLEEQHAIARFLDERITRIREILERKMTLRRSLIEKRDAFVSRAVTYGITLETKTVPTGTLFLPDVASHWTTKRLKFLAEIRYGLGEPPERDIEGIPFVRATDIYRGKIDLSRVTRVNPDSVPWHRKPDLGENELLVVRSGAYTGDSALVTGDAVGCIAGYDMVVTPKHINPKFLSWAMLSKYLLHGQIYLARQRAAQPHLNAEELGDLIIAVPPEKEQEEIVEAIDAYVEKLDGDVAEIDKTIRILSEYSDAIMTAAITGQIKVA